MLSNEFNESNNLNSDEENQFIHELKEKYSLQFSKFVEQIALELVDRYKDTKDCSKKDSLKMAFADAHDMLAEMIAESREFVASMDFDAAKFL